MSRRWLACICTGLAAVAIATPAAAEIVVLRGATLHPVSGPDVAAGMLVMDGSRISALGGSVAVPPGAREIDVTGRHIYPGLIDANTVLGLVEIGSVRGTVDITETGDINPNARAEVALDADSTLPVARAGDLGGDGMSARWPRRRDRGRVARRLELGGSDAPVGLLVNWPSTCAPGASRARRRQRGVARHGARARCAFTMRAAVGRHAARVRRCRRTTRSRWKRCRCCAANR
jgi:hypothetical protein